MFSAADRASLINDAFALVRYVEVFAGFLGSWTFEVKVNYSRNYYQKISMRAKSYGWLIGIKCNCEGLLALCGSNVGAKITGWVLTRTD